MITVRRKLAYPIHTHKEKQNKIKTKTFNMISTIPLFSTSLTQSSTMVGSFVLCAFTRVVKSTPKTKKIMLIVRCICFFCQSILSVRLYMISIICFVILPSGKKRAMGSLYAHYSNLWKLSIYQKL